MKHCIEASRWSNKEKYIPEPLLGMKRGLAIGDKLITVGAIMKSIPVPHPTPPHTETLPSRQEVGVMRKSIDLLLS